MTCSSFAVRAIILADGFTPLAANAIAGGAGSHSVCTCRASRCVNPGAIDHDELDRDVLTSLEGPSQALPAGLSCASLVYPLDAAAPSRKGTCTGTTASLSPSVRVC